MPLSEIATKKAGSSASGAVWILSATTLSAIFAGLAVWQGVEMYERSNQAWDANRSGETIVNMSPRLSMEDEIEALSYHNEVLKVASSRARTAQVWMWVSAGVSVGFAWAAASAWMSENETGIVIVPDGSLYLKTGF